MKTLTKYCLVLSAIAGLLFQSCRETSPTQDLPGTDGTAPAIGDFPLSMGSFWEYKIINNADSVEIATYRVEIASAANYFQSSADTNFRILFKETRTILNIAGFQEYWKFELKPIYTFAGVFGDTIKSTPDASKKSSVDWFVFPLTVNKSWKSQLIGYQVPGNRFLTNFTILNRVLDKVNIMVPAGLFKNTYRIQRNYFNNDNRTVYYEEIDDFCPGVGIISQRLRQVTRKSADIQHDYKLELINYGKIN